jgi:Protein of unknown function (DUF3349)
MIRSLGEFYGVCRVSLDVASYVAIIRAGYPRGIPETDYSTLLAIVRRRLSDGEMAALARDLVARGELTVNIDVADIGAAIARISDELHRRQTSNVSSVALEVIG